MKSIALSAGLATLLVATPALLPAQDARVAALEMMKRDFKATGIAGLDRLDEDAVQALCNRTNSQPSATEAAPLQAELTKAIRLPADGKLLGDWAAGEKIASNGRGMTWRDKPDAPVGGSCYNCHQISPTVSSFGSIGPSLYQFGKLRGYGPETQRYVYSKIYNAKAFNLCSAMPRFGAVGALTEAQIRDLVALLLDPASPVNAK